MKHTFRHRFLIGLMLVTALFVGIPTSVFAAGNSVYFTPASGTTQPGNTFTVSVDAYVIGSWFSSTSSGNGTINFPANLLKVTSIDVSNSNFPSGSVTPDNTSGTISFNGSCGWFCGYSNQNVHLFSFTFQSLASGTANVNFSSITFNTGGASQTGAVYTIASPPPPPTPSPSPSPSPSTSPKPSTSPGSTPKPSTKPKTSPSPSPSPVPSSTPTPAETPAAVNESDGGLKIQNVKVTTNRQENKVSWTVSNSAAIPEFTYGTQKSNLKSEGTVSKQVDGSYVVALTDLKPGTLYYFLIKAATADNLQGANYSGVLTTRGYPVQLTIEQNNLLIPDAKIKLDERIFVTDKNAMITTELSEGKHTAIITPSGSTDSYSASFVVEKKDLPANGNPPIQSFTLNITTKGSTAASSSLVLPFVGAAVLMLAGLCGLVGFMLFRRKKQTNDGSNIDSDLLAATYGTAITDYKRNNTPEPNLSMNIATPTAMQPQQSDPYFESVPQGGAYDDGSLPAGTAPEAAVMPANTAIEAQAMTPNPYFAAPASPPVMPVAAPLPESGTAPQNYAGSPPLPAAVPAVPVPLPAPAPLPTAPLTMPEMPEYTETEQLSTAINSAESTEVAEPTEGSQDSSPSAIYDPETGDLAIVHHHAAVANTVTEVSSTPIGTASQGAEVLQVAPVTQTATPIMTEQASPANVIPVPQVVASLPLPPVSVAAASTVAPIISMPNANSAAATPAPVPAPAPMPIAAPVAPAVATALPSQPIFAQPIQPQLTAPTTS